jgi:hypothetical protein
MRDDRYGIWPGAHRARGLLWRDGLTMVYAPEGTSFNALHRPPRDGDVPAVAPGERATDDGERQADLPEAE